MDWVVVLLLFHSVLLLKDIYREEKGWSCLSKLRYHEGIWQEILGAGVGMRWEHQLMESSSLDCSHFVITVKIKLRNWMIKRAMQDFLIIYHNSFGSFLLNKRLVNSKLTIIIDMRYMYNDFCINARRCQNF